MGKKLAKSKKSGKAGKKPRISDPETLINKVGHQRITINLTRRSVQYFKNLAGQHGVPYQKLIRQIIDDYSKGQL